MTVDVATIVLAAVPSFLAGAVLNVMRGTAASRTAQGERMGKVESRLDWLEGYQAGYDKGYADGAADRLRHGNK